MWFTCILLALTVLSGANGLRFAGLPGEDGGAWGACTHLLHYGMNVDPGLARFLRALALSINGKSVLEFGGGLGLYSSYLAKNIPSAEDVVFIEPQNMTLPVPGLKKRNQLPRQSTVNIFDSSPEQLSKERLTGTFDLLYSIEVMEHIPRELHSKAFDFLAQRAANLVVFGAAHPGQDGTGHIACRAREEFKAEWEDRGFHYLPRFTEALQKAATGPNHPVNTMVFAKSKTFEDLPSKEILKIPGTDMNRDHFHSQNWPDIRNYAKKVHSHKIPCN